MILLFVLACAPVSVPLDSAPRGCSPSTEICDSADNDCDGLVDDDDPGVTGASAFYADLDGDGFGDASVSANACAAPAGFVPDNTDCDDARTAVHPGADEICDDLDDDCDTRIDGQDDDLVGGVTFCPDLDGDTFGDPATSTTACSAPAGFVLDWTDCDDADAGIHPGADEVCDDLDNDCDTLIDGQDESLVGGQTWFVDGDGDGFGSADTANACSVPAPGLVANDADCDDTDATVLSCDGGCVTSRQPARWALDVSRTDEIQLDAVLDPTTIDEQSFRVYGPMSGYLPGTVTYAGSRATFVPASRRLVERRGGRVDCAARDGRGYPALWRVRRRP